MQSTCIRRPHTCTRCPWRRHSHAVRLDPWQKARGNDVSPRETRLLQEPLLFWSLSKLRRLPSNGVQTVSRAPDTLVLNLHTLMMGEAESFVVPFLGALQASISVLLTIFAGVIAAQFNLLSEKSSKEISKLCVRLFLPALLIVNVGSQLHADTGIKYVPVIVWALFYNFSSMLLGWGITRVFNMPEWVTPAIAFNNTTSLPLLLVQSLDATGILSSIDSSSDVIDRAKSFFLVNACVA